jgi:hypothetical protein
MVTGCYHEVVMNRGGQWLRVTALVLLILFSAGAAHASTLGILRCAGQCPVDCPMHAQRLRCHETHRAEPRCHGKPAPIGVHATGCNHGGVPALDVDPPALLPAALAWSPAPAGDSALLLPAGAVPDVSPDPPFHPPQSLAVL